MQIGHKCYKNSHGSRFYKFVGELLLLCIPLVNGWVTVKQHHTMHLYFVESIFLNPLLIHYSRYQQSAYFSLFLEFIIYPTISICLFGVT
jgi:hypothetical protein